MKRIILGIFAFIMTSSLVLAVNPSFALAWDQHPTNYKTHQEINDQALIHFIKEYANNAKYANNGNYPNAAIDKTKSYMGPKVVSNTTFESLPLPDSSHEVKQESLTFENWLVHGGYSADEPNFWASVRHFYDPLKMSGVEELNDQTAFTLKYWPISARSWTFERKDNPFSWRKALEYYKKAMEIPEDSPDRGIPGSGDFRDIPLNSVSAAETREAYLGKSFRALGETMHMMADLVQPAHVRNDSHPFVDKDPLEAVVTDFHVRKYTNSPVDPRIGNKIDAAVDAEYIYIEMAKYTNKYFCSDDTIYDESSGVLPNNGEKPYPHPQCSELQYEERTGIYSENFAYLPHLVPLIQMTYLTHVTNMGGGSPTTEKVIESYAVPPIFADNQSEVLLPIAIKADAKLIDLYFPTMQLEIGVKETDRPGYFTVSCEMTHLIANDKEWERQGFEAIKYSGPVELWCERKGMQVHIADTEFQNGKIRNLLGVCIVDNNPVGEPYGGGYWVRDGDSLYLRANAGGRIFSSNKVKISAPEITWGGWILDGEPVIKETPPTEGNKSIKAEIKQGSATYSIPVMASLGRRSPSDNEMRYVQIGATLADFTFTEAPRELIPGNKVEVTVSGESSGIGKEEIRFGIYSPGIPSKNYSEGLSCEVRVSNDQELTNIPKKDKKTDSATVPQKNEQNKGKLYIEYSLQSPVWQRNVIYNYIYK